MSQNVTDEYRAERMEGMGIMNSRVQFLARFSRKNLWSITMAKMYLKALRTGQVPNYPTDPADIIGRGTWPR
jgi:hypothetical protein